MSTAIQTIEQQPLTPEIIPSATAFPLSADRKALFFRSLIATGGHVSKACELANVSRQRVLQWRADDAAFARDYDDALEYGTENLEERAYSRAMDNSDRMMELLLKARRPSIYRDNIKLDTELSVAPADLDRLGQQIVSSLLKAAQQRQAQLAAAPSDTVTPSDVTP